MRVVFYLVLLVAAFAIGMVGTVAASRVLASRMSSPRPSLEQPARIPASTTGETRSPTVEC